MATKEQVCEYERIQKFLKAHDLWFEVSSLNQTDNGISIYIEWGDWKHSHMFLDNVMKSLGYNLTDEVITEEDGSDTYSSIHYYSK